MSIYVQHTNTLILKTGEFPSSLYIIALYAFFHNGLIINLVLNAINILYSYNTDSTYLFVLNSEHRKTGVRGVIMTWKGWSCLFDSTYLK